MLALIPKEIKLLLRSKITLFQVVFFVLISYLFFLSSIILSKTTSLDFFFKNLELLIIFFAPLFSLRLIAWERSQKTIVLLLLSPVKKINFILAKYFAVAIIFAIINVFLLLPFIWLGFITNFYLPELMLNLLGINLLFFFILALASFYSVFLNGALLNTSLTFFSVLVFYLFFATDLFSENFLTNFLLQLNPFYHLENLKLGILNLSDVIYFLCLNFNLIFWAGQILENQTIKE